MTWRLLLYIIKPEDIKTLSVKVLLEPEIEIIKKYIYKHPALAENFLRMTPNCQRIINISQQKNLSDFPERFNKKKELEEKISRIKQTHPRNRSSYANDQLKNCENELKKITYPELSCNSNAIIFYLNEKNEISYKTKIYGEEISFVIEEELKKTLTEKQESTAKTPREKAECFQKVTNIIEDIKKIFSTPDNTILLANRFKKIDPELLLILENIAINTNETWHPTKNFSQENQICDFFDAMTQHPEHAHNIRRAFNEYGAFFAAHLELQQCCFERINVMYSLATVFCKIDKKISDPELKTSLQEVFKVQPDNIIHSFQKKSSRAGISLRI